MAHMRSARRIPAGVTALVVGFVIAGCGLVGGSGTDEEVTPVAAQGIATATGTGAAATTVAGRAATPPAIDALDAESTATPNNVNVAVSPVEVTQGNIVLTFSMQQAQPMYDPARVKPTSGDQNNENTQPKGYAVLGGSTLKVTNNFDAAQNVPADQPREMLRHVALQIKDKQSGQLIPHADVTMDLLREGRPVLQNQPLVPMVPAGGDVGQLQYGNNVKFPGAGEYQVFVRLEPSPLLGSSSTAVAQFNVSIK